MHVTRNHLSSHLGIVLQPWIISSQSKYLTKICSWKKTSSEDILKVLWRSNSVKLQVCLCLRIQTTSERTTSLNLQHKSLLLQRHCFLQWVKCSKALASCVSILVPPNHFNLQASNTLHVSQSILASTISNPKNFKTGHGQINALPHYLQALIMAQMLSLIHLEFAPLPNAMYAFDLEVHLWGPNQVPHESLARDSKGKASLQDGANVIQLWEQCTTSPTWLESESFCGFFQFLMCKGACGTI